MLNSPEVVVALITSLTAITIAIITGISAWVNSRRSGKKVDDIHHEMQPNSGKSVVDRTARMETQMARMAGNVAEMANVLTEIRMDFGEHATKSEKYYRFADELAAEQNREIV
jgi:TolA-binding protein